MVYCPKRPTLAIASKEAGYPHTVQLRVLQSAMNILDPKGATFGGYSFNSSNMERARIYPDLTRKRYLSFRFGTIRKTLLIRTPKFSCLRKTKS
jgi:hypothetical protein